MQTFVLANYDLEGQLLVRGTVPLDHLDPATTTYFEKKLSRLSGDLDLPLEAKLPGEFPQMEFRIGSDLHGAYVLYYLHDEVVFASLYLRGQNEATEMELMQVFKFLLLDTADADEPTEEEIEEVLSSTAFDFPAIEDRPIAYTVRFSIRAEEEAELQHIEKMDQHLAAAFFAAEVN